MKNKNMRMDKVRRIRVIRKIREARQKQKFKFTRGKRKFYNKLFPNKRSWEKKIQIFHIILPTRMERSTQNDTKRNKTRLNQVPRFFFQKIDFSIDPVDRTNDSFVSKHVGRYRDASHGERDENAFRIQRGKFSRDFTYHLPHSIVPLRFRGWHFQRRKKISMINPLCPTSFHRG